MKLREYQHQIVDAVFREWGDHNSTLFVAPTGSGKTVIFAEIIRRLQPKSGIARVLVVAHREELIWQARDKIHRVSGLPCEIEMAELWTNSSLFETTPVIISTVQTQNSAWGDHKRMGRFDPLLFHAVIIDECHHGVADSYQNLINYYTKNPDLRVLGVTATPDRADEEALGRVFQSVAYDYEILDAINDGWLVPVEQQFIHIDGLDFSHIRTTAGDLNGADLAAVMESEQNLQGVAGASMEVIKDRRSIVFTSSVKQAEVICNILNRHKDNMAAWVCAKTNKDSRREILSRFESGQIQVVCNCGVLTEGFDNPAVEVIVMARPTKSRSLYAQMAGRSMRPLPGIVDQFDAPDDRRKAIASSPKPNCLILDFVGNSGRHKLVCSGDILGGKMEDKVVERAIQMAKNKGGPVSMVEVMEDAEEDLAKELLERKRMEEARKERLVARVKWTAKQVNPFDALDIMPVHQRAWDDGKVLSEKQRAILLKQGVDPDQYTYAHARQILIEIMRRFNGDLCSMKQASVLKRYNVDTSNLSRSKASELLTELASNHWRKPTGWK